MLNYEELSRLRKEIGGKEDERDRLVSEIEKIYGKSKKQEKEIAAEDKYSKKLDEEILNVKDTLKKLKTKTDLMQQQLENQKEHNIEKGEYLAELKQEEENERNRLKALEDQAAMQYESNILEIEELANMRLCLIRQSNSIDQFKCILKPLQYELQNDISQDEDSFLEDPIGSLQDSTISSTTQEISDKETQTLNTQRSHDRGMKYTVFFTIPFALTGVSLTIIPLIKSTKNDTIFLSVGLSFSMLAIVCLVAVTLYSYYKESIADLESPKKLNGNSINNITTQDYSMDQGLN
ncbi:hypothetical protein [Candidatus Mesenet endosymbiont of Phosphuga atrata]|uniref:hypothetical protein n=1 Tax=Candidatus Mesenet endosymbiont of Phosphuga atrata TaxID=3066221 RepID=UPI0030CEA8B9